MRPHLSASLALALAAGCAGRNGGLDMPGISRESPEASPAPRASASAPPEPWALAGQLPSFAVVDDRKLPSKGHNPPYWSSVVRVNAQLQGVYGALGPGVAVPQGAVAVSSHENDAGQAEALFVMTKREPGFDARGGDWEYAIVSPGGTVQVKGVVPLCARCHADASADHLFGPRAPSQRKASVTALGPGDGASVEREQDEGKAPDESEGPAGTPGKPRPGKKRKR